MRDISELETAMEHFGVPPDVSEFVLSSKVSLFQYYLLVSLFIGLMLVGIFIGFWFLTNFFLPFESMEACLNSHRIAPGLALISAMTSGVPIATIAMTHLGLYFPKTMQVSVFAAGFLNDNNDPYSGFFVRRLNENRPLKESPFAYIQRASMIWLPFAWLGFGLAIVLMFAGIVWTNAAC